MNELYAIDPNAVTSPNQLLGIIEKFRSSEGRFVAKFPDSWIDEIRQKISTGSLENTRITEKLKFWTSSLLDVKTEKCTISAPHRRVCVTTGRSARDPLCRQVPSAVHRRRPHRLRFSPHPPDLNCGRHRRKSPPAAFPSRCRAGARRCSRSSRSPRRRSRRAAPRLRARTRA